jgi:hypothetical protein
MNVSEFERVDRLREVIEHKVSRSAVFRLAKSGAIPSARVGRALFVPTNFLALIAQQTRNETSRA